MRDESGRLSGSRLNPEIFVAEMRANRNDPVQKMLLGTPVGGLAERGPATQTRSPPVGPLTSARDRIRPLVRTSIVLISPCGSGVLHRMGQRPTVLRHSQRIASIEPPLAKRTPGKAIGVERSVSGCASSAIGHVRP